MIRIIVFVALLGCVISAPLKKANPVSEFADISKGFQELPLMVGIRGKFSYIEQTDAEVAAEVTSFRRKLKETSIKYNVATRKDLARYASPDDNELKEIMKAVVKDYMVLSPEAKTYIERNHPALTINVQKMMLSLAHDQLKS